MKHSKPFRVLLPILIAGSVLTACQTNSKSGGTSTNSTPNQPKGADLGFAEHTAEVSIPFEGDVAKAKVVIPWFPPPSKLAVAGMSSMRLEQWPEAIKSFKSAVGASPKNWRYRFALAVAAEASGDYALAKANYLEADRLKGGSGLEEARTGLQRIKARGQ